MGCSHGKPPVAPIADSDFSLLQLLVHDAGEKVVKPRRLSRQTDVQGLRRASNSVSCSVPLKKARKAKEGGEPESMAKTYESCWANNETTHRTSFADMPPDVGREMFSSMLESPPGQAPCRATHDHHMDNLSAFLVQVIIAPEALQEKIKASRGKNNFWSNHSIGAQDLFDDIIADRSTGLLTLHCDLDDRKASMFSTIARVDARQPLADPFSDGSGMECHIGFIHPDEQGVLRL